MFYNSLRPMGELLRVSVAFVAASLVAWCVVSGFPMSRVIKPHAISHEQGFAYYAVVEAWRVPWPFEIRFDSLNDSMRSRAFLREDGIALQPPHSAHADIRSAGRGRFSHWGNDRTFFFSASDSSDPRANSRNYAVNAPAQLPELMLFLAFGLYAYAGWLLWRAAHLSEVDRDRAYLVFSIVVFVALFVLGRLWFFVDFPVPER